MWEKELTKLIPPMNPKSRKYNFQGDRYPQYLLLPQCVTELSGLISFENISRSDATFTTSEMEEVEAASRV